MSRLHALLLTDIVDSTRWSQTVGDAEMARLWAAHDRAARDLLPTWRGREIDKSDGLLLLFEAAADGAGYALDYHRALRQLGLPFKARAGLHVGPVTLRHNAAEDVARGAKPLEVDGLAKPVAARVMSAAQAGQTLLSADAVRALGNDGRWRLHSHGHWRLAGVAEPLELFETGDDDAPWMPPPDTDKAYRVLQRDGQWTSARAIPHSLPAERDAFVGRAQPLRDLARLLQGAVRLVSVLGIGGTGKTRLVTRFGRSWLGDFPGGVWFCDLSPARSLDGIAAAVAQGLGVALGRSDPVVQLGHAIDGRGNCLVVLDNFEQVAAWAEPTLGRWLERASRARFVVTTRERLGIVGEQTLALAPLPADDAVALFLRRAEATRHGWQPAADDEAAIGQLVQMLDGLPLAIELAAARVGLMPPRTMLSRMHERFALLRSRSGRHDRQATLRAAFDWSWDLLPDAERAALAQLSVFQGGFGLAAVDAVLDLPASAPGTAPEPADALQALLDKSLVRTVADDRFDLLDSVRDYAGEHLRTPGHFTASGPAAQAAAEQRHGACFAALGPDRAVEHGCIELDNLVAACRRAAARGDAAVAARALAGAWGAIERRGPFRVGVDLADAVLAIPGLSGRDRVETDLISGAALQMSGRGAAAQEALARAVQGARALGERVPEGRALQLLATLQARSGSIDAASDSFERALALLRASGERARECSVLNALGGFCESLGRLKEARQYFEAGLRLAREVGHRRWEGGTAGNLAQFHAQQGRLAEAWPLYEQAVQIARELRDRPWEANARCNLGLLHLVQGRLVEARRELEASLAAARDMGHAQLLAVVQCNLGLVSEALGAPDAALAYHEAAVALARSGGDRRAEGQFLGYLGLLHARQARHDPARDCLIHGEALLRGVSDRISLGILLCARAEAEHRAGDGAAAQQALRLAEQVAEELPDIEPGSEFGLALATWRRRLGHLPG